MVMHSVNALINDIIENRPVVMPRNPEHSPDDYQTAHRLIQHKIRDIKLELENHVEANKDQYRLALANCIDSVQKSEQLLNQVDTICTQVSGDFGLESRIQTVLKDITISTGKLRELRSHHLSLSSISAIRLLLDRYDDHMLQGNYIDATNVLIELGAINIAAPTLESEPLNSFQTHLNSIQAGHNLMLDHAISTALSVLRDPTSISISLSDSIFFGSGVPNIFVESALEAAALMGILSKLLEPFSQRLLKHILVPIIKQFQEGKIFSVENINISNDASKSKLEISMLPLQNIDPSSTENNSQDTLISSLIQVYTTLIDFIADFLAKKKLSQPTQEQFLATVGNNTLLKFEETMTKSILETSIPDEVKDLDSFRGHLVPSLEVLWQTLDRRGIPQSSDSPFRDFLERIDEKFAERLSRKTAECCRTLSFAQDYSAVVTGVPYSFNNDDSGLAFAFPLCTIRHNTKVLVESLDKILQDAVMLKPTGATLIYHATRDIIDIFRASKIFLSRPPLSKIHSLPPQLAMMSHNDCMYVAHWCLFAAATYRDKISLQKGSHLHYIDMALPLQQLAQSYYQNQQHLQLENLSECISSADGFDCLEPHRFSAVEGAIRQTIYHIRHLASIYESVLPRQIYLIAMGQLVDGCCRSIIKEIENLDDIAEEESVKLADLVGRLQDLSGVFLLTPGEGDSQICLFSHLHYSKCMLLGGLLKWNFSRLMDAFRGGELNDFTHSEISRLIRSLFSDTPLRDRNLREIQKTYAH
ncbi:hypothetical protein BASA61_006976 [Batrachochytrium salamandrivorans]|nr:hypothetical protein BASA61_006976 [Batrachochytrium salamandrivorans]